MPFPIRTKTDWKYILIILSALIVSEGVLIYFKKEVVPIRQIPEIKKPKEIPNQIPKVKESGKFIKDSIKWKTYKNEIYGFEFKYPEDWKVRDQSEDKTRIVFAKYPSLYRYACKINVESKENKTLQEWAQENLPYTKVKILPSSKAKNINTSFQGLIVNEALPDVWRPGQPGVVLFSIAAFPYKNYIILVRCTPDIDIGEMQEILSTFRFFEGIGYLKLLSPNGGERWERGNNYLIKWESKGIDTVDIYVKEYYRYDIGTAPATSGEYSVRIGSAPIGSSSVNIPPGKYKVVIRGGSLFDESDDYFEILPAKETTDGWQTYSAPNNEFTFKYPKELPWGNLHCETIEINSIPEDTLGYDKETSLADREALREGKYGEEVDFALPLSKKVIKIDNKIYGKTFMVLFRYEDCEVFFDRILIFYLNDYRVIIRLEGDINKIISSMPDYFMVAENGCGKQKVFKPGYREKFYETLVNGEGSDFAQKWYDTFDEIVKTIKISKY